MAASPLGALKISFLPEMTPSLMRRLFFIAYYFLMRKSFFLTPLQ